MTDQIDTELEAEAIRFGVPYQAYFNMGARERSLTKARWTKRLTAEAGRLGVDSEWWLGLHEEQRIEERPKLVDSLATRKQSTPDEEEAPPPVYTADADVPPTEADPSKRDGVTVGRIEETEKPPDVLGNERTRNPRTLMDLYSRWPVGDGVHYLRVERLQPKVWQQIPCAGYLGDIREPITEQKFQQYFGGREYELTLYGPDPSGKHDPMSGLPKIKALTNPIKLTVPLLPPNLAVLPAARTNQEAQQESSMTQPWNPFAPAGMPMGTPTTPADASVHGKNVDLVTNVLRIATEENRELRKRIEENGTGNQKGMFEFFSKQADQAVANAKADADARERLLRDQIERERLERESAQKRLSEIEKKLEEAAGKAGSPLDLIRAIGETSKDQGDTARTFFEQRLQAQNDQHQALVANMNQRHLDEISRADKRLKDNEDYYKKLVDEERRKFDDRERHLKDEIDRVRKEERDLTEMRLREQKERYEERLKDQEKAFEREIRSVRDNLDTRMTTTIATKDFELASVRERLEEAKESEAEARQKAEENNDPLRVVEKAKAQAEAFGYKPPSDDPKTGWDRFAATAGVGVQQFFSKADQWLPGVLARYQTPGVGVPGAPGTPQLPPGVQGGPSAAPRQQQQQPRRRAVAWAAANQDAPPPVNVPDTPIGFQSGPQSTPPPQPPPAQQPGAGAAPPPAQRTAQNGLHQAFSEQEVMGFLQNLDQAINIGMEPSEFAARFMGVFPDAALKMINVYKPSDVIAMVKALPGSESSSILRRDGKQFVEDLWGEIEKYQRQAQAQAAPAPN